MTVLAAASLAVTLAMAPRLRAGDRWLAAGADSGYGTTGCPERAEA
jgi:hypothetical protein